MKHGHHDDGTATTRTTHPRPAGRPARRLSPTLAAALALAAAIPAGCQWLPGWDEPDQAPPVDLAGTPEEQPAATAEERPAPTAEQRLEDAAAARDAGDYDAALAAFREILRENPTMTTAYVGIGDIHLEREDYAEAEPAFARAARLEPRNFDAQYGHGRALQMLERFRDAIRAYHRALSIDPDHPLANFNMASTYLELGQTRQALTFAEKAVENDPENPDAHINLGAIYADMGRDSDAATHYESALDLSDEPSPDLLLNYIAILSRQRRFEETANTAEFLIRIEPSAEAYERLGWARFRMGDYDASIDAYRNAVEEDPRHWPALNGVGINALNTWLLSDRANTDARREARDAFRRSLRLNPDQQRIVQLMANYNL